MDVSRALCKIWERGEIFKIVINAIKEATFIKKDCKVYPDAQVFAHKLIKSLKLPIIIINTTIITANTTANITGKITSKITSNITMNTITLCITTN